MTKLPTRDLSAAHPRGAASIYSNKPIPPQFSTEQIELFQRLVGEGVA